MAFGVHRNGGINIGGHPGDPVYATADGRVVFVGSQLHDYGQTIIIQHSNHIISIYAHNSTVLVRPKEPVRQGQQIAEMGSTGDADQVMVHFELRKYGTSVDPMPYLTGQVTVDTAVDESAQSQGSSASSWRNDTARHGQYKRASSRDKHRRASARGLARGKHQERSTPSRRQQRASAQGRHKQRADVRQQPQRASTRSNRQSNRQRHTAGSSPQKRSTAQRGHKKRNR
jgi:hypothetical protein